MSVLPITGLPGAIADAAALIEGHGTGAAAEAERLARISRDRGNVIRFCRWRTVGRLCAMLADAGAAGTIH